MAILLETELEDPIRAIKAYEGVRQINEHHEEALKALARIYEATGEWSSCLEVLRSLVIMEADPYERSLHYFRCGSIMESRFHEDEQAIGYYEAAINETSTCLPAIHGLRDLYLRRKEWEKALQTLELEVQLWDDTREEAGVLARMGEIYLHQLDDPSKAIELFSDALTIDSECLPAAVALFEMSFSRGEASKALELSEKLASRMAKEGHPQQRSHFFCRRGQLLASDSNTAGAAESLVLALQLGPDNIEALDWLVKVCRSDADAFDFAAIFRDLEQVYRREDNRCAVSHVLVAAGALSEIAGDAETAMARYQEAMEESPQDLAPVSALSNLLIDLSKVDEAIVVLQKMRRRTEDPAVQIEALMHLAHLYADVVMDHGQAVRTYEEALQLSPNNQEATFQLAQEYYLQGQYEEARDQLSNLIDRALVEGPPRSLSSYAQYLGAVLLRMDDRTGAKQQFTIALEHDELNAAAAIGLSRILEEQGKRKKAIQLLQSTLRKAGKQPAQQEAIINLRRALAKLYLSDADIDAAVVQYQIVIEEGGRVEDRIVLAEVYAQQEGDENRAISGPTASNRTSLGSCVVSIPSNQPAPWMIS
jgi:tetratricopeptide (TPR) repeat protein